MAGKNNATSWIARGANWLISNSNAKDSGADGSKKPPVKPNLYGVHKLNSFKAPKTKK